MFWFSRIWKLWKLYSSSVCGCEEFLVCISDKECGLVSCIWHIYDTSIFIFYQNSCIACWVRIFSIVTMGTQNNPPSNLRSKSSFSLYVSLRQQLDDLGYNNYLSNDSVPLVDKLLRDLLQYKELCMGSQKHYQTARKVPLFSATLTTFTYLNNNIVFLEKWNILAKWLSCNRM